MTRLPNTGKTKEMAESKIASLASGGLDSCVMLGELAKRFDEVIPIYIRSGLSWEETELAALQDFVGALRNNGIKSVQVLDAPMDDVYRNHWSTGGGIIPGYYDPDEKWEIPGRNLILIAKTAVWCRFHEVRFIALGCLRSNPFSDTAPEFFDHLQQALRKGLEMDLAILRPLANLLKSQIIRLGQRYPLELTLSCANPVDRNHCGQCGKCRERINAFAEANVVDHSRYAQRVIM